MPVPHVRDVAAWSTLMKDKVNGPKVIAYATKSHNDDILKFLTVMRDKRHTKNEYDVYIKVGGKYEMNIDHHLREKFDAIAKSEHPDWSKAPWEETTKVVIDLFNHNVADKVPA